VNEPVYCRECRGTADLYGQWLTDLCTHCLMERVRAGEKVPLAYLGDEDTHLFAVCCSNCSGSGVYLVSATQHGTECSRCMGTGWIVADTRGVQRTARWWATYQANRQPSHANTSSLDKSG
jgi:hypothetical protein